MLDRVEVPLMVVVRRGWAEERLTLSTVLPRVSKAETAVALRWKGRLGGARDYLGWDGALWAPVNARKPMDVDGYNAWARDIDLRFNENVLPEFYPWPSSIDRWMGLGDGQYDAVRTALEANGARPLDERFLLVEDELWFRTDGPQLSFHRSMGASCVMPMREYWDDDALLNGSWLSAWGREEAMEVLQASGLDLPEHGEWPEVIEPGLLPRSNGLGESMLWAMSSFLWGTAQRLGSYGSDEVDAILAVRSAFEMAWPDLRRREFMEKPLLKTLVKGGREIDPMDLRSAIRAIAELDRPRVKNTTFLARVLDRSAESFAARQDFSELNDARI